MTEKRCGETRLSRRDFLIWLGVWFGAAVLTELLGGDTLSQENMEGIAEADPTGQGYLTSEYYLRGIKAIQRQAREVGIDARTRDLTIKVFQEMHRQAADNLFVWESEENPGVRTVATRISLLSLVGDLANQQIAEKAKSAIDGKTRGEVEREVVVLSSSTPNKVIETDGGTPTAMEVGIGYVMSRVSEVVGSLNTNKVPKDVELLALGSPYQPGGTITSDWVQKMREDNSYFAAADLQAEFLEHELEKKRTRLILIGHSYGGSMSEFIARKLEERNPGRDWQEEFTAFNGEVKKRGVVRVLADDAVIPTGKSRSEGIIMVVGAVIGMLLAAPAKWDDLSAKRWIEKAYRKQLKMTIGEEALMLGDTDEQRELKERALEIIASDLKTGAVRPGGEKVMPEEIKVYERQGVGDLTAPSREKKRRWKELKSMYRHLGKGTEAVPSPMSQDGNVRTWGREGGHIVDWFRHTERWFKVAKLLMGNNSQEKAS